MQKIYPDTPKLLIPILKRPFLDHLVDYLKKNGHRNIIICTGHLGDKVKDYVSKKKYGISIKLSREGESLGTGGALNLIKDLIEKDFFLLFGDVYTKVNLRKMLEFHNNKKAVVTAVVHRSEHPESSNLVEFDSTGKVTKVIIKPHGRSGKNLYNLAALYILSRDIWKYLPRKTNYDFERDLLFKLVSENVPIYAYNTGEFIMDIGTPERLAKAEKILHK